MESSYYDKNRISEFAAHGDHRALIGGLWDEIGVLQFEFLKVAGLVPGSRLLDIGCGSLRLGVRAVEYLAAGNYWGTDLNESLMQAGYEAEIVPAGLSRKLSKDNLVADGEFTFSGLPRKFDFAIAQSVFTHLPLNHLRLCLSNLSEHLEGPCAFYATFFIAPDNKVAKPVEQDPGGVVTYPHKDPYHCSEADLRYIASGLPWTVEYIGHWNHPRNQKMVLFLKA